MQHYHILKPTPEKLDWEEFLKLNISENLEASITFVIPKDKTHLLEDTAYRVLATCDGTMVINDGEREARAFIVTSRTLMVDQYLMSILEASGIWRSCIKVLPSYLLIYSDDKVSVQTIPDPVDLVALIKETIGLTFQPSVEGDV